MLEVEIDGQMVQITSMEQLEQLIRQGRVLPTTRVIYAGREGVAQQIPGVHFPQTPYASPAAEKTPPASDSASSPPPGSSEYIDYTAPPPSSQGGWGGNPPPPQAGNMAWGTPPNPYGRPAPNGVRPYSFWRDFFLGTFEKFVTATLIRIVWIIYVLGVLLSTLRLLIVVLGNRNASGGLLFLDILGVGEVVVVAGAVVGAGVMLLFGRVWLEMVMVIFRIYETLRSIDEKTRGNGS